MKKLSLLIFFFISFLFLNQANAQARVSDADAYNKAIFVEAFGQGLQGSVNYDMRIKKGAQDGLGFRVGVGGIFAGSSNAGAETEVEGVLAFPVGVNYLIGKQSSAFEVGLGLLPQRVRVDQFSPTKPKIAGENGWGTNGFLNLGYRYQPIHNGFIFRFDWTPVFGDVAFISRFGISAGYGFR